MRGGRAADLDALLTAIYVLVAKPRSGFETPGPVA
jgi:hypothetical protein